MTEWDRCKSLLAPALADTHTLDDVHEAINDGRAELWPLRDSALVTEIVEYPQRRVLRVWLAGGKLDELQRGLPFLDQIAKDLGCSRIELEGRKGWVKVLDGYTERSIVLQKDV